MTGRGGGPTRRALLRAGAVGSATWLIRRPGRAAAAAAPVVVDVHAHNFNATDLPVPGFVAHFIPFLTDFSREVWEEPDKLCRKLVEEVTKAIDAHAPMAAVELQEVAAMTAWPGPVGDSPKADEAADKVAARAAWLGRLFGAKWDLKAVMRRAAQVVNLTAHRRAEVTATMAATYPEVSLFVPMLVDYDGWVGGNASDKAPSPLGDQIKVHGALARLSMKAPLGKQPGTGGARMHPFVAFDPRRADGLALVKTAIETEGFIGVKVYPPVGFAPANNSCLQPNMADAKEVDAALDALYAYCTQNDVPITTHCSTGNEFSLGLHDLVAPHRWAPVLAKFPKLRLNLGHFGHMEGIDSKRGLRSCEAWLRQAGALMEQYQNVYADLSGSDLNNDGTAATYAGFLRQAFAKYKSIPKRMMYGSDWWLNRFFDGAPDYLTKFQASFTKQFPDDKDMYADVLGRNALRFLGLSSDDGGRAKNAQRLTALYQASGSAIPSWLSA